MSARIGRPARSARARRERAAALRAVITAIDSGTLRIDGTHPLDGTEHTAEGVRAELVAEVARLEEGTAP